MGDLTDKDFRDMLPLFERENSFAEACSKLSNHPGSDDQFHFLCRVLDLLTFYRNTAEPVDETALAAMMRGEWCLWEAYSKWDISINPFLGHFMDVWEYRNDEVNMRLTGPTIVIGIILSGQAKDLANMNPEQVLKNIPPLHLLESSISIRTLQLALLQQQYEPNHPLLLNKYTSSTETAAQPSATNDFDSDKVTLGDATSVREGFLSVPPSPAPMSRDNSQLSRENLLVGGKERSLLSKGLEQASCTPLSSDETLVLKELIQKAPGVALETCEPTVQMFNGTIQNNPEIFKELLLPLLLDSQFREETFSTLTFLPVSLPVLETLYLIIKSDPSVLRDQTSQSSRLVHDFLAHAERQLETLAKEGRRNSASADECSRLVDMMCLFFESLLREQRIDVEEYRLEIREFCLKFSWNYEATNIYRQLSAGDEILYGID